ncbi:MAG TPA: hypothetical protein ENI05_04870, partial [Porticoccus sp.]|nr:hypothetical protein [Porticoccus sp.]
MSEQLFTLPQVVVFDTNAALVSGAKANFYIAGTLTRQNTYSDSALTTPHANPVVADGNGLLDPIYLDATLNYKVDITDSLDSSLEGYPVDNITAALTADEVGTALWPVTTGETSAGVTPTNFGYEPGNVLRYGTNTTPGTTDMQSASDNALSVDGVNVVFPPGTYYLATAANILNDVTIIAYGATIKGGGVDSNIDLFTCAVAKNVSVEGGTFQDCRYGFYFGTAFSSLSVVDASFSASAMGILINSVAAATGSVNVNNCAFDAVEIGVDLRSSPIGTVHVTNNKFTNIAYQTLSSRPSPLDKAIVSGLWYQAISGSAGVSSVVVSGNFVKGVTGPTSGNTNEKEVHGLAVSLDATLDCDVVMDSNVIIDTAGHSTLDLGDEGLLARGRSVVVSNNILRDAGSTEGCIYAKGTTYHKVVGNTVEASAGNSRLSYMTGLISASGEPIVSDNTFIGLPEGIKTRAIKGHYFNNHFSNVTACILHAMEDGAAHKYTVVDGNVSDSDCSSFFANETLDAGTATFGDTIITNNKIYCKSGAVSIKAAVNFIFDNNLCQRASPNATRELITVRADKVITNCYIRNNVFANFEDSNTTGRVTTIQNDTGSGKAVTPNLHIENNHFVIGTLPLVLGSLTYDDLVITGNTFSAPGAAIS